MEVEGFRIIIIMIVREIGLPDFVKIVEGESKKRDLLRYADTAIRLKGWVIPILKLKEIQCGEIR